MGRASARNLQFVAMRMLTFATLVALLLVAVGTKRVEAQSSPNCFIQGPEGDFGTFDSKVCSCDESCQCNVAALTCETACIGCSTTPTGPTVPGCTTVDDCSYNVKYGSSVVCFEGRCRTCYIRDFIETLPWSGSDYCQRACGTPGDERDNEHCREGDNGEAPFCFSAKSFGHTELVFLNSQGDKFPFGGICLGCRDGTYPNADFTGCVAPGPPVEAPTPATAEPPPATPPVNPPAQIQPPPATSPVNPPAVTQPPPATSPLTPPAITQPPPATSPVNSTGGRAPPPATTPMKSPPFREPPRPATLPVLPTSFAPSGAPAGSVPNATLEQHSVRLWLVILSIGWTLSWNMIKLL